MNQELWNNEVNIDESCLSKMKLKKNHFDSKILIRESQLVSSRMRLILVFQKRNSKILSQMLEKNTIQRVEQILPYNALIHWYFLSTMVKSGWRMSSHFRIRRLRRFIVIIFYLLI